MDALKLLPGRPWPLGSHMRDGGVNFAVWSAHAQALELCLFDDEGRSEVARLPVLHRTGNVWHVFAPGARPGQVYGWRAHGPWSPAQGHRFNPRKLLLDPWAREIVEPPGGFDPLGPHVGHAPGDPSRPDPRDNAAEALKARVVGDEGAAPAGLRTPLSDTLIYELHVKGFTRLMPGVPEAQRGTYAGLASDAAIDYLQRLGVSAVCLLPVHHHLDEGRLAATGLVNYWGYNTIGFFCPDPRLSASGPGRAARDEFRAMVERLHDAGIEVLLDVVYNHTAESDDHGPTLSWRGLDNAGWYRLDPAAPARYENWTGCGNTLDTHQPHGLQLVMDSLRHWVQVMGVDGFRFDLAPVLGRAERDFHARSPFFQAVAQDPVLAGVKMIAEPWDIGPHGYRLGAFPAGWLEWNDRFRDAARAFWLRGECKRGEIALRLCASADIFHRDHRAPAESINYITSHDGYTLADLVSYEQRHNHANGEDNRDGHGHNLSWNCGVEGPTDRAEVNALRRRLQRALLACAVLSQGTPMIAAGSEAGHSQAGNNNAYCQDNGTSWIDWARADRELIAFTAHVIALRRQWLPLGSSWYTGRADAHGRDDIAWLDPSGERMAAHHWADAHSRTLMAHIGVAGRRPQPLLLMLNADAHDRDFVLPAGRWCALLDSSRPDGKCNWRRADEATFRVSARSLVLLAEGPD